MPTRERRPATAIEARKRRRVPLTRERVLRRALRIADKQGLAALSMRKLAQAVVLDRVTYLTTF